MPYKKYSYSYNTFCTKTIVFQLKSAAILGTSYQICEELTLTLLILEKFTGMLCYFIKLIKNRNHAAVANNA